MAEDNSPEAKAEEVKKPPRPLYMTMLIWVLAPLLSWAFFPTLILFTCGMIPSFVAYMVDPLQNKHITKTVGYANATGCFIVAFDMWAHHSSIEQAIRLLSLPSNWLIMFGTAAVGWLVYFIMRPLIDVYLSLSFDVRRKRLLEREEELIEEWGEAVKQKALIISPEMLAADEKAIKAEMARINGKAADSDEAVDSNEAVVGNKALADNEIIADNKDEDDNKNPTP